MTKIADETEYRRHVRIWKVLYALANRLICRKFRMTHEDLDVEGPVLLVSNHVTGWDPLLVAMSLRKKHVYYVGSEHIFRLGAVSKLLRFFLAPIARPKAGSGLETVRECLEHLKAGHSVCLFAEGERTWDGRSAEIFPATGKLVKMSGASLVTYRLSGGYLTLPRWRKTLRHGKMHGAPVGIYTPETLAAMRPKEVNDLINRDIFEDAWAAQKASGVVFTGRKPAEGLERALYLCPGCGKIGTLRTKDSRIFCACGFGALYSENGFSALQDTDGDRGEAPFPTLVEWDAWQKEALRRYVREAPADRPLLSDDRLRFSEIDAGHEGRRLGTGTLRMYPDRLCFSGLEIPLAEIRTMAMIQANRLVFSTKDGYYEVYSKPHARVNLRKYLEVRNGAAGQ